MAKICSIHGDYMVMDPDNGLYGVWYVNPHDDTDDAYLSEHETLYEATITAQFHAEIDRAWGSK
jgi:hypothetical protein